ncbi:carbohydrate binding domain-containing protein [Streptomyces zhihengii]
MGVLIAASSRPLPEELRSRTPVPPKASSRSSTATSPPAPPWWWTANSPAAVTDGELCADIVGGTANPWDAIIGQDGVDLLAGEGYVLSFTAHATAPVAIRTALQMAVEPYTAEHLSTDQITTEPQTFTHTFTAKADNDAAQLGFQTGGHDQAFTLCLDDVSLTGGTATPPYEPDTGSPVRVNQVGYLTGGPKSGTFVTEAAEPLTWTLNAPPAPRRPPAPPRCSARTRPRASTCTPSTSASSPGRPGLHRHHRRRDERAVRHRRRPVRTAAHGRAGVLLPQPQRHRDRRRPGRRGVRPTRRTPGHGTQPGRR